MSERIVDDPTPHWRPDAYEVGLIVPCFNEEAVIPHLLEGLRQLQAALAPMPLYVVFVDDGSRDRTAALLAEACAARPNFGLVRFTRNFGHQSAVTAGMTCARGDVIGVIDADLQDPPLVLLDMIARWREGFDVVYGVRKQRKEGWLLRGAYAAFYRILSKVSNIDIPLDAGDFCVMDRQVVEALNALPEHNRFLRGLRSWVGFRQVGLEYERAARCAGRPKYGLQALTRLAMDGFVTFSPAPLRLASGMGLIASALGLLAILCIVVRKLSGADLPWGWASTIATMLLFSGINLIVLGIIGEYLSRIFDEVKNRPHYLIRQTLGWVRAHKKHADAGNA